jgi:hypothetical protein
MVYNTQYLEVFSAAHLVVIDQQDLSAEADGRTAARNIGTSEQFAYTNFGC